MSRTLVPFAGALAVLTVACGHACAQPPSPDTTGSAVMLLRSRSAARELLTSLRTTLEKQLAAHGPAGAVSVCADIAQDLSDAVADRNGIGIRRVSERWRNPKDEPDVYELTVLKLFADAMRETTLTDQSEHAGVVIEDGARVFRYMKPIRIQGMCTACHGQPARMDPAVMKALADRYPADRATGYAIGDLRGAVSVRIPFPPPRIR
jgi:hypothetical protein